VHWFAIRIVPVFVVAGERRRTASFRLPEKRLLVLACRNLVLALRQDPAYFGRRNNIQIERVDDPFNRWAVRFVLVFVRAQPRLLPVDGRAEQHRGHTAGHGRGRRQQGALTDLMEDNMVTRYHGGCCGLDRLAIVVVVVLRLTGLLVLIQTDVLSSLICDVKL
jgi:hypothetical protein